MAESLENGAPMGSSASSSSVAANLVEPPSPSSSGSNGDENKQSLEQQQQQGEKSDTELGESESDSCGASVSLFFLYYFLQLKWNVQFVSRRASTQRNCPVVTSFVFSASRWVASFSTGSYFFISLLKKSNTKHSCIMLIKKFALHYLGSTEFVRFGLIRSAFGSHNYAV